MLLMSKLTKKIPRPLVEFVLRIITNCYIFFFKFKFKRLVIRKNTSDHHVFRDIFLFNEFKLPIDADPKLIIDAGAYIGLSSLYYSFQFPDAQIIAVEPESSNFDILTKNTELHSKIKRINSGIWYKNARLKIVDSQSEKWAFTVQEVDESDLDGIKAITIDEILEDSGYSEIDILKIDIEGSEKEIFSRNSENWLKKVKIIVLELHDRLIPGCSDSVYNALKKQEWEEYKKGEKVIFINKKFQNS
jgi:FkbM family methyltransferase